MSRKYKVGDKVIISGISVIVKAGSSCQGCPFNDQRCGRLKDHSGYISCFDDCEGVWRKCKDEFIKF